MATGLKLTVLSPERRLLESTEVEEVTLTGSEGQVQILPGHAPMLGTLETGVFNYRLEGGQEASGVISSGFFQVVNSQGGGTITLLAETLELKGEINLDRARKAQKEAEDMLKSADLDESAFKKYQLKLERALIRQQAASKDHGA